MFETLLGDEVAQQDQRAGRNRANQLEQYNRIYKEDPHLGDHAAAHEPHNLETGLKQKTSAGHSLFLAAVWTCARFRQVRKHTLSLAFPIKPTLTCYNHLSDTIQSS